MSILRRVFQKEPADRVVRHAEGEERPSAVVVDYSAARAKAIAWLGDRYLLAKPINRRAAAG